MKNTENEFQSPLSHIMTLYMTQCKTLMSDCGYMDRLRHIRDFDKYLVSISYQDRELINEKLVTTWISTHKHLASGTIRLYTNSLRKFLSFYTKVTGICTYEPPLFNNEDRYIPYIFSDEEMSVIYNLVDNYKNGFMNKLPYIHLEFPMVIRLLDSNGLRLTELITIKMTEVYLAQGILKLVKTKNNRQRLVPLSCDMNSILKAYCKVLNLQENSPVYLFPRKNFHEPLKKWDIEDRFRKVLVKAGIRNNRSTNMFAREACIHCLRHRYTLRVIKQLMAENISLEDMIPYISTYLGHKSITQTEAYMKFFADVFPNELEKFGKEASKLLPDKSIWDEWM